MQEQVGKNKQDIADLKSVNYQLATVGIKVVGQEVYPENLPDPLTYGGDLGDAYMVGAEAPFDMYIYTRPAAGQTDNRWFNIGAFPLAGPEGPQGETGATGPAGSAAIWRTGGTNPSILDTDKAGDMYLNTTTGMVYRFDGTNWIAQGTIVGPRGAQGPEGPQGPRGPQGDTGPRGVQGPVGESFQVIGVVSTVGSLPDPDTVSRNAAYIVDDGVDKDLYIVVLDEDNDPIWYNAGPFLGIAAGFASPTASAVALPANTPPTATVTATGPDNAKVFSFTFGIPVAYDLENTDTTAPSTTLGYTQNVIAKRTYKRVFKSLAEIFGNDAPASSYLTDIMAAMSDLAPCKAILVNYTGNKIVSDAPDQSEIEITFGSSTYNFNNAKCSAGGNYYLLTGFDYDEGLDQAVAHWDRVVTEGTLPSSGGGYMPNLLINPNFKINQRGGASYSTANGYTVDRWCLYVGRLTQYTSGAGRTTASTENLRIIQKLEPNANLLGKSVTLSAQFTVNDTAFIISCTAQIPASYDGTSTTTDLVIKEVNSKRLKITFNNFDGAIWAGIEWTNYSVGVCNWAKLELGSSATPFSPPDPAEELEKCQRFFVRYSTGTYIGCGIVHDSNLSRGKVLVNLPTELYRTPNISSSGLKSEIASYSSDTTLVSSSFEKNKAALVVSCGSFTTTGAAFILSIASGYIAIDAEIY